MDGPNRKAWRSLLLATAAVAAASLVLSPILYLRTSEAFRELQQNRVDLCRETNRRHDRTIAKLDAEIAKLPPAQRAQARRNRAATVALLEQITPKRDCGRTLQP